MARIQRKEESDSNRYYRNLDYYEVLLTLK